MKKILSLLLLLCMVTGIFCTAPVTAVAKEVNIAETYAPIIQVESVNLTPYKDSYGEIVLKVTGATDVTYQWQAGFMDTGNMIDLDDNQAYHGTKTNHFRLTAINKLDQLDFRCKITYDGGSLYSQVFRFTFIDRSVLSNAYVSGLSHPYFTQTPDYTVTALQNDGYSVSKVEWYGPQVGATGPLMNSTDVFLPGGYYCRIYLKPDDAYKFDDSSQLSVSIDTKTSSYTSTVNIRKDDSGNYYGVIYFVVEQNSDIAPGILDFEWKDPSDTATNVNLGKAYLGTDSMDIPFAFKIKALPRNMALADYTVYGSTYIQCDGKNLYYTHTGDRVNLKDLATVPGRYYIYHELFLLDPEGNEIATEYVCYFVNVYAPIFITDLSVEVDEPVAGLDAEIAFSNKTEGCAVNNMYWYDITDSERVLMNNTDTFEAGRTYQVEMWLKANDGYYMNTDEDGCLDVNARINGKPAEVLLAYSDKAAGFTMDFTVPGDNIDPSNPTGPTEPSTGGEDIPTDPTNPDILGLLGDVNEDGKVNIKDATLIQKAIANLTELTGIGEALADADLNTRINIKDATAIQKHIAGIETGYPIGKSFA